ncbi:MAG TPA: glycoside hydrolase family 57 protein [Chloroflexota bacterium]|nr:glycoside hydrolase family 57 protein [Chloroflexota bacterium]
MADVRPLRLVLLWHMHQPDFRDFATGEFTQPWVYLHAIKDYTDMAAHLENHPGVHAVVNLVPILLDQLEDYADQFATRKMRDSLLRLLARDNLDELDAAERNRVLDQCFRANHSKMIEPFTPYKRLRDLFQYIVSVEGDPARYLSGQYLADLLTWYHLSWTGETVRRKEEVVVRLMTQGVNFTHADRMALFDLIGGLIADIIPRYRRLAESGRVELSTTPHHHPIAPLLLDFACVREALPDARLPAAELYPGGRSRIMWHLESAQHSHRRRFGAPAPGVWPAEGALSTPFLHLLAEHKVAWTASGQRVLANTLRKAGLPADAPQEFLYRPYHLEVEGHRLHCFFRDDLLSDLIGFEYKGWHGKDAATHFIAQLEQIRVHAPEGESPVVSVILDGENAWEYYPYNGFYFLDELYRALESQPSMRSATFSEVLGDLGGGGLARPLPPLVAGSWVYGNLSTWIASEQKNRAWDLLVSAKQSYNLVMASGRLDETAMQAAARQIAICEGSDWFWWFGDYNPAEAVAMFDRLFRANLANLYRLLQLAPPAQLSEPISRGGGHPDMGGAMRRAA